MHGAYTSNDRGEGAHDRHEAGQHNGLAAVALVEGMGLEQMFLLDQPGITGKDGRPHVAAYGIVGGISQGPGGQHDQHDRGVAHVAGTGHHAGGKKQGIAGQKGRYHKAGFAENDDKENGIDPDAVICHQLEQVGVNMQNEIHKMGKQFHGLPLVS